MPPHTFFFSSIRGPGATPFLEHLTPSSLSSLSPFSSTLSVLLNPEGGIIDDTVICKHSPDVYYVVTNAGRRDRDLAWFDEQIQKWNNSGKDKVHLEVLEDWGLVALQGESHLPKNSFLVRVSHTSHRSQSCRIPSAVSWEGGPQDIDVWQVQVHGN